MTPNSPLPQDDESATAPGPLSDRSANIEPFLPAHPGGGTLDAAAHVTSPAAAAADVPRLANWGWRMLSGLIDGLIIAIPNTVARVTMRPYPMVMTQTAITFVFAAVYAWMECATGQTPGKKVVGTRTVRETDGQLLGFGRALGRKLCHLLDLVPCYLGFLWPAWDTKKQTFADKIVSSVVLKL